MCCGTFVQFFNGHQYLFATLYKSFTLQETSFKTNRLVLYIQTIPIPGSSDTDALSRPLVSHPVSVNLTLSVTEDLNITKQINTKQKLRRGVESGVEWRVPHMTFTKEAWTFFMS